MPEDLFDAPSILASFEAVAACLEELPAGLAVAFVCVVLSRAVHFQPGYLYGLVGGFTFAVALDHREEGQARFVGFVIALAAAMVGWVLFAPSATQRTTCTRTSACSWPTRSSPRCSSAASRAHSSPWCRCSSSPGITSSAGAGSRGRILAFATTFLFVDVLLRPETGYLGKSSTASAVVTYGLFALFGAASVAFWGWFRLHPDPAPSPEHEVSVPA